jgi:DNA polymerase-3 subunit gamma/tau
MSYQVIARKWRPQTFGDVVFQDHVSKTIQNSITQGRITHAYLFSGPRGVGKTTMARILAKALNCVDGPTPTPCGVCENCVEIKKGNSFDVIEIDGASNNGVDNIRELRENVNFAPAKSKYKIYIIDEVHMVTTQAFNALLKTLEEPPPHVVFIFATTEMHKIPETILSRCQKYFFKKIPVEKVVEHLRKIITKEGYKISENALFPVARIADGSMRDAQSLLEQVISFSGVATGGDKEISEEDALSIMGVVPTESYIRLMNLISDTDGKGLMAEVDKIVSMGIDISRYSSGLIEVIRSLRLINSGVDLQGILGLSAEEMKSLRNSAVKFTDEELSRFFVIGADLVKNLRFSGNDRVYLEMTLLDMVSVRKTPSIADIIKHLESGIGTVEQQPQGDAEKKNEKIVQPVNSGNLSLNDSWNRFLKDLEVKKDKLFFILKPAEAVFNSGVLTLHYPDGLDSSNYKEILDSETLKSIEEKFSQILGSAITVKSRNPFPSKDAESAEKIAEQRKTEAAESQEEDKSRPLLNAEMILNPEKEDYNIESHAVTKLQSAFHGQIIKKGENIC